MGSILITTGWIGAVSHNACTSIPHCCNSIISTHPHPYLLISAHLHAPVSSAWLAGYERAHGTCPDWWHRCGGGASIGRESKLLAIESPWLQFSSEGMRF
eukprot:COSAG01_NODE_12253_length_1773_cov_1.383513_1_plen_100_part_00